MDPDIAGADGSPHQKLAQHVYTSSPALHIPPGRTCGRFMLDLLMSSPTASSDAILRA
jgi:hypothetical protein